MEDARVCAEDSSVLFEWEDKRGDCIGEDGGGEESVEMSDGKVPSGLDGTTTRRPWSCLDDATRAIAFVIICVISSSVSRSSTNTLRGCQKESSRDIGVTYRHRLSNAPFSLKDGFSVVAPMSLCTN